ncbi:37S ribosomal protein S7, mitochondrial [Smittium mucronatum]|uniref:37S ribosomal protein S7, mitochondrial n=1 Tax=Smittium mucronatum TaxID=133383 RepID=A0A1R0GRG0_9FUNG|nr:37S ribosomal protein S7, mitochondrial [Smittium mucronatum]
MSFLNQIKVCTKTFGISSSRSTFLGISNKFNSLLVSNYVTQAQRELLKKAERKVEISVTSTGISSNVPIDDKLLLRDDPLLSQLVNTIMRDGKKSRAQKQVGEAMLEIRKATNSNPYQILSDAIEMVSPLMTTVSSKKGSKVVMIPKPLNVRQRRRKAILWILAESKRRGARTFSTRLSTEILAVINGSSQALAKKLNMHKVVLANRAQVKAPFNN